VSISLDNEFLITSTLENKAMLYQLKTMRPFIPSVAIKTQLVLADSFFKKNALTASLDRTIKFWDIEKGICSRTEVNYRLFIITI
jgi:WD40 repeat protein